jgi:hypothetical protein
MVRYAALTHPTNKGVASPHLPYNDGRILRDRHYLPSRFTQGVLRQVK